MEYASDGLPFSVLKALPCFEAGRLTIVVCPFLISQLGDPTRDESGRRTGLPAANDKSAKL